MGAAGCATAVRGAAHLSRLGGDERGRRSKINLPALNLVAQKLPETEISSAQTEVAGKGSGARTTLAKNGMSCVGQMPYLGKFWSKFGTQLPETSISFAFGHSGGNASRRPSLAPPCSPPRPRRARRVTSVSSSARALPPMNPYPSPAPNDIPKGKARYTGEGQTKWPIPPEMAG